ncbi:MAG TPA: hypothetical protein VEC96_12775, partial [Anaerolineae bacterium]|nr:hypothetical protein [Anaerolineae bacterium]
MRENWLPKLIIVLASIGWSSSALFPQPPLLAAGTPTPAATPAASPAARELSGVVVDANGPVAGATVRVQLTENYTMTATDGSFTLSDLSITQ